MLERYQGCLVGGAVGDALGQPLEFLPDYDEVMKYPNAYQILDFHYYLNNRFPKGLNKMIKSPLRVFKKGEFTDDTDQTLAMVDNFLEDGINPERYAQRLVDWYESLGEKGCGKTTRAVMELLKNGVSWDQAGRLAFEKGAPPANGSLMRTSPVGLYFAGDPININQASRMYSIITHAHPDAILSCQIASQFIGQLVCGRDKVESMEFLKNQFGESLDRVLETDETQHLGGAFTTLKISLNTFLETKSFEEAVVKAINRRGDTDSYGAVTGAFAGAHDGIKNIPRRWRNALNPVSAIDIAKKAEQLYKKRYETKIPGVNWSL